MPTTSVLVGGPKSLAKPPVPQLQPADDDRRDFGDALTTRRLVYDGVLKAAQTLPPISNSRYTLALKGVDYAGKDDYSLSQQKEAILGGKTLSRRLRGTWELSDNATGQVLDSREMTVANVPYFSERGTMIHNGNEYTLNNQLRLRPGIFTRIKNNGEIEAHANILPGKGMAHRYFLDPDKGVFKLKMGQANIPLMPLLRAMGATDSMLRDAWGNELFAANASKDDQAGLNKLFQRLVRSRDMVEGVSKQELLKQAIESMEMDPEVNQSTLGKPYGNLSLDAVLDTTKKLLAVSRGEQDVDDRDHLAYQTLMGPEDLFAERIGKDYGGLRREILRRATFTGSLKGVQSGALTKQLQAALLSSGLGSALEEINPGEILDKQSKVSRLGEGGIGSLDAIPDESRSVQPSHFGFFDPVRTPECYDDKTEVMTESGWKAWPDVRDSDLLACLVNGQLEFHKPIRLIQSDYDWVLFGAKTKTCEYLVTPNHRMRVRRGHDTCHWRFELASETHESHERLVQSGGHEPLAGQSVDLGIPKFERRTHNNKELPVEEIELLDWAEFVGWYLAEGSLAADLSRSSYRIQISQSEQANRSNCKRIRDLLDRLPMSWCPNSDRRGVTISGRHIYEWAAQFGKSYDKFIPEVAFRWPVAARKRLLEALLLGDGRKTVKGSHKGDRKQFCSTSERLAKDVQRLAFGLGIASKIVFEPDDRAERFFGCWVVHLHSRTTKQFGRGKRSKASDFFVENYKGTVYCAEVPGGLLYVRRNGKTGFWCGNSLKAGIDVNIAGPVRKGRDGRIYAQFTDVKTGKPVWRSPQDIHNMTVAFPGEMRRKSKRIGAMRGGKLGFFPRDEVDLVLPHFENAFSHLGAMVPMKSAVKAQRMAMASRMFTQALPLVEPESPWVQSGVPGQEDVSYEEQFGRHMGAMRAEQDATVLSVGADKIRLKYADGTQEDRQLYHNWPFNRKTLLHNTPVVRPGDTVKAGDLLARSNFTDAKGVTALGRNAYVAYLPWGGKNFEDALVMSESYAKKMSSEHMYQHDLDITDDYKTSKRDYVSLFGSKYDRKTLDRMDDDGVIAPGTMVHHGDPLILAAKRRDQARNKVHKKGQSSFSDATVTWDHHMDGVVTDVFKGPKGSKVVVKAAVPMQVGDKLCFDGETEVLTRDGWKPVAEVGLNDEVCTLQNGAEIQYLHPAAFHRYETGGEMYRIKSQQVDLLVTSKHRMYVQLRNREEFSLEPAVSIFGKRVRYKKDGEWEGGRSPERVVLPGVVVSAGQAGRGERRLADVTLTVPTYLLLVGAFVSEGNLVDQPASGSYGIDISQVNVEGKQQLLEALDAAKIKYCFGDYGRKIRIYSKVLLEHFRDLGSGARHKRLPREVFGWAKQDLKVLFKWLMWGDGHSKPNGHPVSYTTVSKQLADDVQQLCLHIGMAANIKRQPGGRQMIRGKHYECLPKYAVQIVSKKLRPTVNHGHSKQQNSQQEFLIKDFDDPVFCVTVPGNVLYVRRNGTPCWSGNSGRYGDKGVIADIIPDADMPHDAEGRPFELLLNPLGLPSRTNPAQIMEAVLGQIAAKTGKPYKIKDFEDIEDLAKFALEEARKHGVNPMQLVTDPSNGRGIGDVFTGNRWFMKLHHTAEGKGQGRGTGGYTMEGQPAKGGPTGSKRVSLLDNNALISHGATEVIRDAGAIRGQKNEEFWLPFLQGVTPPKPKVPLVYTKFLNQLRAAGIHVVEDGTRTHIMAMTNDDVKTLAGDRELQNGETVRFEKGLEPVKGGLFDPTLTGGHGGNKWSFIKLKEPLPNPVMEEPIRRMLDLTGPKFESILEGKEKLGPFGTGPQAIQAALSNINIDKAIEFARAEIASGRKSKRDAASRRLGYLKSAQRMGLHPKDWMMDRVPVLPPIFRPVAVMSDKKLPLVADPNYLYKELLEANQNLETMRDRVDDISDERKALYGAFKAVVGLGDPAHPKLKESNVKGILKHVFGSSPKLGVLQRRLLSSTVDVVGRAVITPNPDLDMDHVGLPEDRAWDIYRNFVARRLKRRGMPLTQALKEVEQRTDRARQELLNEMDARPVIINRAPVLHRFGMMAFYPRLAKNDTLQISPLVVEGFNADFDGDAMQYHVPVSDEAVSEAVEKMLPSRNLLAPADFKSVVHKPTQEYTGGLYAATRGPGRKSRRHTFRNKRDMVAAYRRGEINIDDEVTLLEKD